MWLKKETKQVVCMRPNKKIKRNEEKTEESFIKRIKQLITKTIRNKKYQLQKYDLLKEKREIYKQIIKLSRRNHCLPDTQRRFK